MSKGNTLIIFGMVLCCLSAFFNANEPVWVIGSFSGVLMGSFLLIAANDL